VDMVGQGGVRKLTMLQWLCSDAKTCRNIGNEKQFARTLRKMRSLLNEVEEEFHEQEKIHKSD